MCQCVLGLITHIFVLGGLGWRRGRCGSWLRVPHRLEGDQPILDQGGKPLEGLRLLELALAGLEWAPEFQAILPPIDVVPMLSPRGFVLAGDNGAGCPENLQKLLDLLSRRVCRLEVAEEGSVLGLV